MLRYFEDVQRIIQGVLFRIATDYSGFLFFCFFFVQLWTDCELHFGWHSSDSWQLRWCFIRWMMSKLLSLKAAKLSALRGWLSSSVGIELTELSVKSLTTLQWGAWKFYYIDLFSLVCFYLLVHCSVSILPEIIHLPTQIAFRRSPDFIFPVLMRGILRRSQDNQRAQTLRRVLGLPLGWEHIAMETFQRHRHFWS